MIGTGLACPGAAPFSHWLTAPYRRRMIRIAIRPAAFEAIARRMHEDDLQGRLIERQLPTAQAALTMC